MSRMLRLIDAAVPYAARMTRDEALGARDAVVGVFVDGAEVTITEVHDDDTVTVVDNGESVVGRFPLADVEVSGRR